MGHVSYRAGLTEPETAVFAACIGWPELGAFDWGSHDGPETSATLIVQVESFGSGPAMQLAGPGLEHPTTVRLGLPQGVEALWRPNHAAFPRGVDVILCAGSALAALPRSVRMEAA